MEFLIQINPCNPKELKEYLDILDDKGLIGFIEDEHIEDQQPPTENTWTTNDCPVITREEIRDKMVALNRKGLGKQLIEILNKYGADKVSTLSEEHYFEVMAEMEDLENEDRD